MDSLTQAALGAAIGEAIIGKKIGWKASILGAAIATVPDLDIVLTPFFTEVQKVSLHRGYSHSILFCLAFSVVLMWLLQRSEWCKEIKPFHLWTFTFLTLLTHVILDTFTSYGTQLFLPITDWRVSFDSISIIDPIYTLPLLIGVLGSNYLFKRKHTRSSIPNSVGLMVSSLYLLFTLANKQQVQNRFFEQLDKNNLSFYKILTVPVRVANTVWYGVAKDRDQLHIGKYSTLSKEPIIFHSFPINDHLLDDLDDHLIDRMKWFAQGFYTVAEKDGKIRIYNMQCDMQGVRQFGDYRAPTAFYYEIEHSDNGKYLLSSGMHNLNNE